MAIYKQNRKLAKIYKGNTKARYIYKGSSLVYRSKIQVTEALMYNSPGSISFQFPYEILSLTITVVGGGGGGSTGAAYSSSAWSSGGAGGAGGYCKKTYNSSELANLSGKSFTLTVGAGGSAPSGLAAKGGVGGNSSFVNQIAYGGNPGAGGWASSGGSGGGAGGGDVNTIGAKGENGKAFYDIIWENYFDEAEMVNEYDLTLFIREEDGRYSKYEETHYQKAFEISEVKEAVKEAGMELVAVYDAFTRKPPREDSDRVYFVVRECGK